MTETTQHSRHRQRAPQHTGVLMMLVSLLVGAVMLGAGPARADDPGDPPADPGPVVPVVPVVPVPPIVVIPPIIVPAPPVPVPVITSPPAPGQPPSPPVVSAPAHHPHPAKKHHKKGHHTGGSTVSAPAPATVEPASSVSLVLAPEAPTTASAAEHRHVSRHEFALTPTTSALTPLPTAEAAPQAGVMTTARLVSSPTTGATVAAPPWAPVALMGLCFVLVGVTLTYRRRAAQVGYRRPRLRDL